MLERPPPRRDEGRWVPNEPAPYEAPPQIVRIVDNTDGDAVDAVLTAVGTWRGYRNYDHAKLRADPDYGVEGFVYT